MSRRNRNKNKQFAPGVVMTPAQPAETVTEPEEGVEVAEEGEETAATSVEDVIAQAMEPKDQEQPKEETPPPPEEPPKEPDTVTPAATAIETKQYKIPARKVMAEDLMPGAKLSPMQRCVMSPQQLHTPPGLKLLEMFKEYKEAMNIKTTDRYEHAKRAKMLSAIVQQTCPYKLKNTQVGKDLVMIFFNELMQGWGKIFTDSTMFRLDYSLGNPAQIDKMDIFTSAMIQLVEAATGASDHIAFQNDRLAQVIDSPAVMTAVENLRVGIEKRILQRKK